MNELPTLKIQCPQFFELVERVSDLEKYVKELERFQDITRAQYKKAIGNSRTAPFKCPVCDGVGNRKPFVLNNVLIIEQPCLSCEGKGIVWG